jgi:uncharacterized membrane protein YebE (DUF533 family)
MAWAYAELAKEAAKRGGPVALRNFYRGQGVIIGGVITGGAIAGTVAYDKRSKRRAAAEAAPETTTEAASSEHPPAPGPAQ